MGPRKYCGIVAKCLLKINFCFEIFPILNPKSITIEPKKKLSPRQFSNGNLVASTFGLPVVFQLKSAFFV